MDLLHAYGREGGNAADYNKHNTTLNIHQANKTTEQKLKKESLHTTKMQRLIFQRKNQTLLKIKLLLFIKTVIVLVAITFNYNRRVNLILSKKTAIIS